MLERDSDIYAFARDRVVSVTPLSQDLTSRTDLVQLGHMLRAWPNKGIGMIRTQGLSKYFQANGSGLRPWTASPTGQRRRGLWVPRPMALARRLRFGC